MDRGLELGLNFFDTADVYGDGRGLTESIVGRWFAQGDRRREKVVIATKVYNTRSEWPNDGRLSALHIRQACEDSLRRMQTDHIDLYQMHHVDRDTPWEEIWQAMDLLVAQGKVLYVGSSNFAGVAHREGERGGDATRIARSGVGAEPLQPQRADGRARGAPGVRRLRRGRDPVEPARRRTARRRARRPCRGRSTRWRRRAGTDRGAAHEARSVGEAVRGDRRAARRRRARVAAPQPGRDRADHRARARSSRSTRHWARSTCELDDDVLAELDRIFPGPGGPAPEAYAW